MRILLLVHEALIPKDQPMTAKQLDEVLWKTEYDVFQSLKRNKFDIKILGVSEELKPLREAIENYKPHLVFNLLEEFKGEAIFDQNIVSYLEIMNVKYSGCNPRGLILSRDKALCKKILRYHRIPTPDFMVFPLNKSIKKIADNKFPLFVKTLNEESSTGISMHSVVNDNKQLRERVLFLQGRYQTDVIAESFIDGEEYYVGVLGNQKLEVFTPWQLFLDGLPEDHPKVATEKVKWDTNYRNKYNIRTGQAENLTPLQHSRLKALCKKAYKVLGLSGYARMDIRTNSKGDFFILEVNPNPDIGFGEDFAKSAEISGYDYDMLIKKIIHLGKKWQPKS